MTVTISIALKRALCAHQKPISSDSLIMKMVRKKFHSKVFMERLTRISPTPIYWFKLSPV